MNIKDILDTTILYNLHSHTEFCDGRAPLSEMTAAAFNAGLLYHGITPHSPICVPSPCNMEAGRLEEYLDACSREKEKYRARMTVLTGMEIDWLSADWGPHIDYFQNLPLDYSIGSVHFIPDPKGEFHDCDGRFERFSQYLRDFYRNDIRYVVEKYFEQVLTMMERGGFDILGHFDKIAGNASKVDAEIENQGWYEALIDDVVSHAASSDVIIEVNTKAFEKEGRFFPSRKWWDKLSDAGLSLCVNSDAHYPDRILSARDEALRILKRFPGC